MVSGAKRAVVPSLTGVAAVATVATVGSYTQPVAPPDLDLSALIVEGSSTNPTGEGIPEFYGGLFDTQPVINVNFFSGPFGVYDALQSNPGSNTVLSSGWGAANVSLLLTYLDLTDSENSSLFVLDNNVARPNGGFGTRYPAFAVIGVNPIPSPTEPGAQVIDVGYEYDINGNTPAYVLNAVSMANSLATYFDNRLNQSTVTLPVTANGDIDYTACPDCPTTFADGDEYDVTVNGEPAVISQVGTTTYISYRRDGLPLLQPLRQYGGDVGVKIAWVVEPALKAVVDYGYPNNDALADPDVYTPARLVPTVAETQTFAGQFRSGVHQGIDRLDDDPPGSLTETARTETPRTPTPTLRLRPLSSTSATDDDDSSKPTLRFTPFRGVREAVRSVHQTFGISEDSSDGSADSTPTTVGETTESQGSATP